jgi:hypothetical protein
MDYDLHGPVRDAFDAGISITSASGRGLGLGNPDCFGPVKWDRAIRPVPFGAQMPALKALRTGPYQSEVHRQFYVHVGPQGHSWVHSSALGESRLLSYYS